MKVPDIYFEDYWGKLNAEHDGGIYHSYAYEDENGLILHRFIKRATNILPDTYDILSPWGFNGPIILQCKEGKKNDLILSYNEDFQAYCAANNIVAEYIRFSPWIRNHEDFKAIYDIHKNNYTVGIDLTKDFLRQEFSKARRLEVRNAEKRGIEIQFDFKGETIEEFFRLYNIMFEKNNKDNPDNPSRLSWKYITDTIRMCEGHVFIVNGIVEGTVASSGLFIYSDNYVHYHLCGNDPKYFGLNVDTLITYKVCEWGKNNNKTTLHLGGAHKESLFAYKKQFTKEGIYDFYIGHKIRLKDLYDQLIEIKGKANMHYFPAYRE